MTLRILLVDDHPMLRNGVRQCISQGPNFSVVGEASTGQEAIQLAADLSPDIVIMDAHLPDMFGTEATRRILVRAPQTKIIFFSSDGTRFLVDEALQVGACGFVWKQGSVSELIQAIEMVMEGRLYLSPEISAPIIHDYRTSLAGDGPMPSRALSERDKQLLRMIAEGRRNKEIATALKISVKSAEAYRSRLMKKLGCASSAELVRFAIREGIAVP